MEGDEAAVGPGSTAPRYVPEGRLTGLPKQSHSSAAKVKHWREHIQDKIKEADCHISRAAQIANDNRYLENLPWLRTPSVMHAIRNGLARINSYRRLHLDYLDRLWAAEDPAHVHRIRDDPEVMLMWEAMRQTVACVCVQFEYLSLVLQTIADSFGRVSCGGKLGETKGVLASVIEACANEADNQLKILAHYIVAIPPDAMLQACRDASLNLLDRRSVMLSFFFVELEEYKWLAAQMLTLEGPTESSAHKEK
eukprot:Protomagalhaensia_sp_Gyna_25__1790@NODE_1943_length_1396_cov_9_456890_g1602_i0_p1_GENE_NODE_1943_length_1396_cov_9_456890_g1602_i0NODE_1943_length_1396_cov_9_456890_g1602_i0_p1_ORF_typecomplete_len252_score35_90DeoC/PF01791_9/22DeoC/PF01791_9/0_17_NODE_1943_length_1396_cov_9_456890_g1602_i06381393